MHQDRTTPITYSLPFGKLSTGENLFMIQPGIPLDIALDQAANMFACAADLMAEIDDADPQLARKLSQAALHFIDAGKALTEASTQVV